MNTAVWIAQVLLSTLMLVVGTMKTFLPVAQLEKFSWTQRSSAGFIRFVGISELFIGAGLVFPWLTGCLPFLTALAAAALCLIMLLAIAEHIRHKEENEIFKNIIILALAASVVVARFVPLK